MDSMELRSLLNLIMCCDPWPCEDSGNEGDVKFFANRMSVEAGYEDWVDAYHHLVA